MQVWRRDRKLQSTIIQIQQATVLPWNPQCYQELWFNKRLKVPKYGKQNGDT